MQWAQNLCRMCGHISEVCQPIHQKDSHLEYKIKVCINLEVYKSDLKPKQMCENCVVKINNFYDYIQLCLIVDEKFESELSHGWSSGNSIINVGVQKSSVIVTARSVSEVDVPVLDLYKDTILPLENLNVPGCTINDQEIINIVDGSENFNTGLGSNITNFTAPFIYDKPYPTELFNDATLSNTHNYQNQFNSSVVNNKTSSYNCTGKSFDNAINCSNYFYNKCETPLNLNNTMDQHLENIDGDGDCDRKSQKNNKDYSSKVKVISVQTIKDIVKQTTDGNVESPVVDVKPRKTYECVHCSKKFMRHISLNAHMSVHTKVRPFVCEICSKSFAIKCDLSNHMKIHSDEYKCRECNKAFPVPSKLARHLRIHTNQRPFVCDFKNCGQAFADKRNLVSHGSIHSEIRNFKCADCSKAFKRKNLLKNHMKVHSSYKPYVCDVCGKSYKWNSNLLIHKKKHTGFICPYCKKSFNKVVKYNRHKKDCQIDKT